MQQDPSDELVTDALFAGHGILTDAARYLTRRLGRPLSRSELASRVETSRVLSAVQQIAHQRAFEQAMQAGREVRRRKRSEAMRASWARRRGETVDAGLPEADASDALNARARTRASRGVTPADVQAARDMRLCMARTRQGYPCTRRVVPGRNRCPSHGGLSSGPKTQEGRERIARAARERWRRHREGRSR